MQQLPVALETTHWVKYVRWDVITRWRRNATSFDGEQRGTDRSEHKPRYPYAFASNDPAFRGISGGVLWLISSPNYGAYRLPPSLIARLHVTEVVSRDDPQTQEIDDEVRRAGKWIALADRELSAYLPLNNAFNVLRQLRFQGRSNKLRKLPEGIGTNPCLRGGRYSDLPGYFQRHRVVASRSVRMLREYADAVQMGRCVFLSYRRRDFTHAELDEFAEMLSNNSVSCWWDRRNLPEEDLDPFEPLLKDILGDAVRQSTFLVALMRSGYLESEPDSSKPTWVRQEWDHAREEIERGGRWHRMVRIAVVFGDQPAAKDWIEPGDLRVAVAPDESARDVAQRVIPLLPA